MKNLFIYFIYLFSLLNLACETAPTSNTPQSPKQDLASSPKIVAQEENPPAAGFNAKNSDKKAVEIADSVMKAMGGRKAWDDTQYIRWNFFGRRTLIWDKQRGNVRIEIPEQESVYLVNVFNNDGKVMLKGAEVKNEEALAKAVQTGIDIWINDSYWLVMPFKLKDSGVTLKYLGDQPTAAGQDAALLELTFRKVGKTPQNKYWVYVDKATNLVSQWDYFENASDAEAQISTPWDNYTTHGAIQLSDNRGKNSLTDIAVHKDVPFTVFSSFDPVDTSTFN